MKTIGERQFERQFGRLLLSDDLPILFRDLTAMANKLYRKLALLRDDDQIRRTKTDLIATLSERKDVQTAMARVAELTTAGTLNSERVRLRAEADARGDDRFAREFSELQTQMREWFERHGELLDRLDSAAKRDPTQSNEIERLWRVLHTENLLDVVKVLFNPVNRGPGNKKGRRAEFTRPQVLQAEKLMEAGVLQAEAARRATGKKRAETLEHELRIRRELDPDLRRDFE